MCVMSMFATLTSEIYLSLRPRIVLTENPKIFKLYLPCSVIPVSTPPSRTENVCTRQHSNTRPTDIITKIPGSRASDQWLITFIFRSEILTHCCRNEKSFHTNSEVLHYNSLTVINCV